jgi:hypothetical protein
VGRSRKELTPRYGRFGNYLHPFSADAHRRHHEDLIWNKIAKHLAGRFTVVSTDLQVMAREREARDRLTIFA